jgi:hypothetical protein
METSGDEEFKRGLRKKALILALIALVVLLVVLWAWLQSANQQQAQLLQQQALAGETLPTASVIPEVTTIPKISEPSRTQEAAAEESEATCSILVEEEWVPIPCDAGPEYLIEQGLLDLPEPGSSGSSTNSGGAGSSSGTNSSGSNSGGDNPRLRLPDFSATDGPVEPIGSLDCPDQRDDDPQLYDYCWDGFVAPQFVRTELYSCRAGDFEGEPAIEFTVKIELVGGNYRDHYMVGVGRDWDGFNRGYTLLSKGWVIGPNDYDVLVQIPTSWYTEATFYPMKESYQGKTLYGAKELAAWVDSPVKVSELPGHCWPPNQ